MIAVCLFCTCAHSEQTRARSTLHATHGRQDHSTGRAAQLTVAAAPLSQAGRRPAGGCGCAREVAPSLAYRCVAGPTALWTAVKSAKLLQFPKTPFYKFGLGSNIWLSNLAHES